MITGYKWINTSKVCIKNDENDRCIMMIHYENYTEAKKETQPI